MDGQGDCERRSFSLTALHLDVAPVVLDEAVTDRKAQADTFDLALGGKKAGKESQTNAA